MPKLLFILLSWFAIFPIEASSESPVITPKIIGGIESENNELPWQAYLNMSFPDGDGTKTFICGGVVISPTAVLTAAHCMRNGSTTAAAEDVDVWAGITSIFSANRLNAVSVSDIIIHPSYSSSRFANDIAILMLSSPLPDSAVPINIATDSEQQSVDNEFDNGWVSNGDRVANLLVSGWGSTDPNSSGSGSTKLRQTLLSGVPDRTCDGMWGSNINTGDYSIYLCAGSTSPDLARDSCFGDSGGPLVWQNPQAAADSDFGLRLVGLVSFGEGCAGRLPGVYTQTSNYRSWIANEVGNSVFNQATSTFSINPFLSDYGNAGEGIVVNNTSSNSGDGGGGNIDFRYLLGLGLLALLRTRRNNHDAESSIDGFKRH
ncbi:S1 family peptidase [Photobacterium minamisatsumaniensis]|uniref:S1 family peptidase n=1 Tax=Photobacterium minamisatsumaniensis TaxID=2910233 RepID=UPI003D108717